MWKCSQCGVETQAVKRLEFISFPDLLVIQLKRFSYSIAAGSRKNSSFVDLPIQLDLKLDSDHAGEETQPSVFELIAISNHIGTSMQGAHYTAHVRKRTDNTDQWYKCDDGSVSPVDVSRIAENAYLMIYQRQSPVV